MSTAAGVIFSVIARKSIKEKGGAVNGSPLLYFRLHDTIRDSLSCRLWHVQKVDILIRLLRSQRWILTVYKILPTLIGLMIGVEFCGSPVLWSGLPVCLRRL